MHTSRSTMPSECAGDRNGLEVPVYRLIEEPNTLYGLLCFIHENPDQRGTLSDADSLELLQPPSFSNAFAPHAPRRQKHEP